MAEDRVFNLLTQQNKPFSTQGVADQLAHFGVKKTQAQRALDALVERSRIRCKEFGKAKLYVALQDEAAELSKEDMEAQKQASARLTEEVKALASDVKRQQKCIQDLSSSLTVAEIAAKSRQLSKELTENKKRLLGLREGAVLVTKEEREAAEATFARYLEAWVRNRGIFRQCWDSVTENMDQKQSDLRAEIGVETDEDAGDRLDALQKLLPSKRPRLK